MRGISGITKAVVICLIAAAAPPLLDWLHSAFSGECISFVYTYLSEIQFLVASLFAITILCRCHSALRWCRWGLLVTYAVLVFVLIISTRGLQIAKIEISLCAAVTLFMGVYVVKQLRVKECLHTHDESAPEEQLGRTRYYKSAIRLIRKNAALTHPRR